MAEKKVRLHGVTGSPYSNRVEIALKLKGVEYEYIEEDLRNKSADLLKYNPVHKKIPVLVHGNKAIAESQVILEYIDETWNSGTKIMPQDPYERALARFWARFIDDKLFQSVYKALWRGEEQAIKEALENLKILEKELQGKRFLGGESIGFVDIVANLLSYWIVAVEEAIGKVIVTQEAFPYICRWRHEFESCDAVKDVLPQRERIVPRYKGYIEALRAQTSSN